jgi:hypothetical protein
LIIHGLLPQVFFNHGAAYSLSKGTEYSQQLISYRSFHQELETGMTINGLNSKPLGGHQKMLGPFHEQCPPCQSSP